MIGISPEGGLPKAGAGVLWASAPVEGASTPAVIASVSATATRRKGWKRPTGPPRNTEQRSGQGSMFCKLSHEHRPSGMPSVPMPLGRCSWESLQNMLPWPERCSVLRGGPVGRFHPLRRVAVALTLAITAGVLAPSTGALAQSTPAPAFGSPPSGEIPIIFDDTHVYAKPDMLKAGRVLAGLVRNGVLMVPLRSMFEQMGATVTWDEATKTADVAKPGSDVKVTLDKPVVVVNGEDRPLDVPPMIYRGVVVVPVRGISEAMGAYVQWIPDRRVVVVRYLSAPPPT